MKRGRPPVYSDISYGELGDWAGRKTMIKVSKAWLEALRGQPAPSSPTKSPDKESESKIEYKITDLNE